MGTINRQDSPAPTVRGTVEWAAEQIRLCGNPRGFRRPISRTRINTFLKANGFPEVE